MKHRISTLCSTQYRVVHSAFTGPIGVGTWIREDVRRDLLRSEANLQKTKLFNRKQGEFPRCKLLGFCPEVYSDCQLLQRLGFSNYILE